MTPLQSLEEEIEKTQLFLQRRFGISVEDDVLKYFLNDNDMRKIIRDAMRSYIQEQIELSRFSWDGYNPNDDYYKGYIQKEGDVYNKKILKPRIPGKAYDKDGVLIPHIELFREEAKRLMEQNPNIVAIATRGGVVFEYKMVPNNIIKDNY